MTMTTESTPTLDTWLYRHRACSDARAWAAAYPDTAEGRQRAWDECPRGDWMLWIGGKLSGEPGSPARRLLVRAAVACARTVLDKIPGEVDRAEIASVLDALDAYALDPTAQADLTALRRRAWAVRSKCAAVAAAYAAAVAAAYAAATAAATAAAAYATDAATAATAAAAYAADAAAYAANAAADAAAVAAAYAADAAAAYAAAYAAAARQAHLARCAQLVRELMPQPPG